MTKRYVQAYIAFMMIGAMNIGAAAPKPITVHVNQDDSVDLTNLGDDSVTAESGQRAEPSPDASSTASEQNTAARDASSAEAASGAESTPLGRDTGSNAPSLVGQQSPVVSDAIPLPPVAAPFVRPVVPATATDQVQQVETAPLTAPKPTERSASLDQPVLSTTPRPAPDVAVPSELPRTSSNAQERYRSKMMDEASAARPDGTPVQPENPAVVRRYLMTDRRTYLSRTAR